MFAEQGYDKGELIFPDGGHSSFFLGLPDGNVASADNVMCANGFYVIAEELGFDVDDVLGEEPYGKFFMYEDEDGIEHEDCAISIWTPQEFMVKMKQCKQLANNNMTNESKNMSRKNTIRLTESELKNMIIESVTKILKENCNGYNSVDMGDESEEVMESCNKLNEESLRGTHSDVSYQLAGELLEVMEPISLIAKLGERMGFFTLRKYLESIARIELSDNYGEDEEL